VSQVETAIVRALPWDDRRGTWGMVLFITTEAVLFLMLFFSYFYLGRDKPRWPTDEPPRLSVALAMLVALGASSVILVWGERQIRAGREGVARAAAVGTIVLGAAFLALQALEYREHLEKLAPSTDAYASIFYTITSVHALHVALGLLMLAYVVALPSLESAEPPHRAFRNVSLYWHFVDAVWFVIVALLYVLPNVKELSP